MIKLENINKYYKSQSGRFHVLKDINLTLPDVGMVYIVGKSGSGKSTLLNVIGGIDKYDTGNLLIESSTDKNGEIKKQTLNMKDFKKKDYNAYRNSYTSFIFQEFNVIKGLTVKENVELSLDLQQKSLKDYHDDVLSILEKVGLKGKENRRINQLSGGERQRVAIARALIKKPKVLIADEPTGNLDGKNRDAVMDILKNLSKEILILVVTHDKYLAGRYGDREITIKDGEIIEDSILHEENLKYNVIDNEGINQISPKTSVSFKLAWKGFLLNKFRFIFIICLFSLSLVFAGSVVSLYLADTTKEYAVFQKDYDNFVVNLSNKYNYRGSTTTSGFYNYDLDEAKGFFKIDKYSYMDSFRTMKVEIPVDANKELDGYTTVNGYYKNQINYIQIFEDEEIINNNFNLDVDLTVNGAYPIYITDYLANSLMFQGYYKNEANPDDVIGKKISFPNSINKFTIAGIIYTNHSDFANLNSQNKLKKDKERLAAFEDNLSIYNSIFIKKDIYTSFFTGRNVYSFYDNILYNNKKENTIINDVLFTTSSNDSNYLIGKEPLKPKDGEMTQVAVSKGFVEKVIKTSVDSLSIVGKGISLNGANTHNFYLSGTKRVPIPLDFIITGVTDSEEIAIYAPSLNESFAYDSWLKSSYVQGGFLSVIISKDLETNSKIYRNLLDNDITIDNLSFVKLQLVDEFIRNNIYVFAAMFFAFCLFSILMIFNFVIINLKNSTRDIGIYMSLGMNGFKIALIYLFQVLIISFISMLIGIIFSTIFLYSIDASFSKDAILNFAILKPTFLGVLIVIAISFITPICAVISPLLSLSRKKPIDVIKVS